MATGNKSFPQMHPVKGFKLGTTSAGIKTPGRKDLVVMALQPGATVAGVFTQNAFCAAPVVVAKQHLSAAGERRFSPTLKNPQPPFYKKMEKL